MPWTSSATDTEATLAEAALQLWVQLGAVLSSPKLQKRSLLPAPATPFFQTPSQTLPWGEDQQGALVNFAEQSAVFPA